MRWGAWAYLWWQRMMMALHFLNCVVLESTRFVIRHSPATFLTLRRDF